MAFSTDADLVKIRPNILDLGVSAWDDQRAEAERQLTRSLDVRFYRDAARARGIDWTKTPLDPDLVDAAQVNRLSCLKTLEVAYTYLSKDKKDGDAFMDQARHFGAEYDKELEAVLDEGVNYDWDGSGTVDADEKKSGKPRTLKRC